MSSLTATEPSPAYHKVSDIPAPLWYYLIENKISLFIGKGMLLFSRNPGDILRRVHKGSGLPMFTAILLTIVISMTHLTWSARQWLNSMLIHSITSNIHDRL